VRQKAGLRGRCSSTNTGGDQYRRGRSASTFTLPSPLNCWILPIVAPIPILRGGSHGASCARYPPRQERLGSCRPTPEPWITSLSGGFLMKQFMIVVAMLCLATSGCANSRMARKGCCDPGCGCDVCCEPECGVCDPGCDCEECCDPCCGDSCCTDGCCTDGCDGCDGNGCALGNGGLLGRNGNGMGNGMGNGRGGYGAANGCPPGCSVCGACGGAGCQGCGGCGFVHALATGFCPHAGGYPEQPNFNTGPPSAQTAYPYYTVRGPRDFLQNNPPSIGPY
jgi:hypothetical protein